MVGASHLYNLGTREAEAEAHKFEASLLKDETLSQKTRLQEKRSPVVCRS